MSVPRPENLGRMTTAQPIIFYDIPANVDAVPTKAISPNTWKVRLALNYKRIPYKTEWVEMSDIAETFKRAGIPPSEAKWPDGAPYYSCPAIVDPSTGVTMSESALIVEYLDKQYPDTPKLFPDGTRALQYAFYNVFEKKMPMLLPVCIPKSIEKMNPASQAYLYPSREKLFGKPVKELYPVGEALVKTWDHFKEEFDVVNSWYEKGKGDGPYLLGKTPGFVDFVVTAWVLWIRNLFGEESTEWKNVSSWNDGRWAALVKGFEKYQFVDQ